MTETVTVFVQTRLHGARGGLRTLKALSLIPIPKALEQARMARVRAMLWVVDGMVVQFRLTSTSEWQDGVHLSAHLDLETEELVMSVDGREAGRIPKKRKA